VKPGDKLGPYEILALIGKGGMGEVYRARDPRLNRDVAIKISNAQFTERFTREARAIAALNHTNICHLYDVGPDYLVMEYVEGQDLRGPMDFEDARPIVQQLIDGIEAAHEKNIVHRDLKPANIKITPEGVVKILDFGLAKAMEPPSDNSNPENSPTLTMGATVAGTILGTAAYMAPEQAKGKTADKRSDIWSFGVIVYEVLTGKRLFQGESAVEILGGVLNQEPEISAAPQHVHKLLRWCLEKDRKQRLASISDARRLLTENEAATSTAAAPSRSRLGWVAWGLAVIGWAAALLLTAWMFLRPVPLPEVTRFEIHAPEGSRLPLGTPAPSPDGRTIAYTVIGKDGVTRIHVRLMDSIESRALPGTENAVHPFWSPDGRSLAFGAGNSLKRVDLVGGSVRTLTQFGGAFQGSWNQDGVILFASPTGLSRIPADGGVPAPAAKPDEKRGETFVGFPYFLSDGKRFLVRVMHAHVRTSIELASVGSLERTTASYRLGVRFRDCHHLPGGLLLPFSQGETASKRGAPLMITPVYPKSNAAMVGRSAKVKSLEPITSTCAPSSADVLEYSEKKIRANHLVRLLATFLTGTKPGILFQISTRRLAGHAAVSLLSSISLRKVSPLANSAWVIERLLTGSAPWAENVRVQ